MVLSLRLLRLDLNLKNFFLSILILGCRLPKTDFSILEFSVVSPSQHITSLNSLLDASYNFFLSDFDLVIIKNLNNKEELDLINNKVSFGSFKNAYFISQNKRYSISILAKEMVRVQILSYIEGLYDQRLGVVVDFAFKGHNYGIVIFNFSEEISADLDISIVEDQIAYLNYKYENLLFILNKLELVLLDVVIRSGFFSLVHDSMSQMHIINNINYRVYSNFQAQISLYTLIYVLLSYLYDSSSIDNFPKSIIIK